MKNFKYISFCLLLAVLTVFTACEEEDIMTYNTERSAVNFIGSSLEYSFLTNPTDEYVIEVDVQVMGDTANYDRYFNVAIVQDLTTASDNQYEIVEGIVKAGEFKGKLYVRVFKSDALDDTMAEVGIKLVDSDDFFAGNKEKDEFLIGFTNKIVLPPLQYFKYFFCKYKSTEVYRIFVLTTGLTDFGRTEYMQFGTEGTPAIATKFGDYIKEWNKNHPDNHLKHDDGDHAGEDIIPIYYTKSKYD